MFKQVFIDQFTILKILIYDKFDFKQDIDLKQLIWSKSGHHIYMCSNTVRDIKINQPRDQLNHVLSQTIIH